MANPNKCLYTSLCWDDETQKLYFADEQGYVYIANIYLGEKFTIEKQLCNPDSKKVSQSSTLYWPVSKIQ